MPPDTHHFSYVLIDVDVLARANEQRHGQLRRVVGEQNDQATYNKIMILCILVPLSKSVKPCGLDSALPMHARKSVRCKMAASASGRIFKHPIVAKRHVKDEYEGREYRCWCGQVSHTRNEDTIHQRTHDPLVTCPVRGCNKAYNLANSFNKHIHNKNTHLVQLSEAQIKEYV